NVSETTTKEIIASYEAVGTYLGNLEEDLDIKISPQGSMALGTMIKPLSSDKNGEYDVDLICQLTNGESLTPEQVKHIVGNRLHESPRYSKMLDPEGKRCWTLKYTDFHMDVLPCTPLSSENSNSIRITERLDNNTYKDGISNPKGYIEWFKAKMQLVYTEALQNYAEKRNVEIEKIHLYNLRTPLQMAIQILKRHRDIMFEG
ncbi:nucleotidyltransferase domain-containing protein, partial [Streptococcus sp. VTCC 12905]